VGSPVVFVYGTAPYSDIYGIAWMLADSYEEHIHKYVQYRTRRILMGPLDLTERDRDDMHHLLNRLNNDLRRLVLHHSG
jgi:hypothetical protein